MVVAGSLQAGCCATNLFPGSQTSWSSSSPWRLVFAPAPQLAISSIVLMQFVAGPGWKQDQYSDARLKKAPCSAQMVIIRPKEAASLTQLIHKAALAIITLPLLWFLTSPSPPPGSTPPRLETFVTKLGHPGDVFYRSSLSTAKGQGAASQGTPGPDDESGEGSTDGENIHRTTPVTCCSWQDGFITQ